MRRAKTDVEISLEAEEFIWESAGLTEAHRWILPIVSKWLDQARSTRVLDIGCGNGAFTNALNPTTRELVGIDASQSGIEIANRCGQGPRFLRASIDSPLPADLRGDFDAVISVEVIEHLFSPRDLFRRASEALLPGGHLIVSTPYHGYLKNLALALTGKFDDHWHPLRDHGHIKFFSARTLTQLFRDEGFQLVSWARVGRVPWLARSMVFCGRRA